MLVGIAALLTMLFIAWIILQALGGHFPKPHIIMYLLAALTCVYALAYFLSMSINFFIKLAVSTAIGLILIAFALSMQRRSRTNSQQKPPT